MRITISSIRTVVCSALLVCLCSPLTGRVSAGVPALEFQETCLRSGDSDAHWSPDGKKIVFVSGRRGNADIWMMDADGTNAIDLTSDSDAPETNPVWSPDGKLIAFMSTRDQNSNLWIMHADGRHIESVDSDHNHVYGRPIWSKHGERIAVQVFNLATGKLDVGIVDPTTKTLHNLTHDTGYAFSSPAWSADEHQLVLLTLGYSDVFVIQTDGSGLTPLNLTLHNIEAAGSPVDDSILVTKVPQVGRAYGDANSDVFLVDGQHNEVNLTQDNPGADRSPAWSPDGTHIAFISDREGSRAVWTMTSTGANPTNLTKNFGGKVWQFDWSPDGQRIVFSAAIDVMSQLWTVNADGSELRNISPCMK